MEFHRTFLKRVDEQANVGPALWVTEAFQNFLERVKNKRDSERTLGRLMVNPQSVVRIALCALSGTAQLR
jgi:hypothetical protein